MVGSGFEPAPDPDALTTRPQRPHNCIIMSTDNALYHHTPVLAVSRLVSLLYHNGHREYVSYHHTHDLTVMTKYHCIMMTQTMYQIS